MFDSASARSQPNECLILLLRLIPRFRSAGFVAQAVAANINTDQFGYDRLAQPQELRGGDAPVPRTRLNFLHVLASEHSRVDV